ncbi:MAG: ABC transporter permease [Defluviitaleaceae bacterium]|nr:ABC transporter permease [Defluviitaleaceae bacterium]
MNSIKAIFKKQLKDTYKNMVVLIQFFLFPVVAWVMTEMVAKSDENIPNTMFVTMMAAIFAGMGLIPLVASIIAEDRERKSLRFLVMAGVKSGAYLLGVGSVILLVSILPAFAFSFIAGYAGREFWLFTAVIMSGVAASILIGATVGIVSKNQQAATGLAMPIAMVLGFGPMIAPFNETVARIFHPFYTMQFTVVVESTYTYAWQPFAIIWANVAVLTVLFIIAYAVKGLRG